MSEQKEEYLIDKELHFASDFEEFPANKGKGGHGGVRVAGPGKKIGRPLLSKEVKRKAMTFKLPKLLADKLKEEESQTGLLVKLLAEYYGVNLKDLETG